MPAEHLATVLIVSALIWACSAIAAAIVGPRARRRAMILPAVGGLVVLTGAVYAGAIASPGRNVVLQLLSSIAAFDVRQIVAAWLGICLGAVLALSCWPKYAQPAVRRPAWTSVRQVTLATAVLGAYLLAGLVVAHRALLSRFSRLASLSRNVPADTDVSVEPGFKIDVYHECKFAPTQIVIGPDGNIYCTGFSAIEEAMALGRGVVMKVAKNSATGDLQEIRIAELNRPMGLAFLGSDLYVAQSGYDVRAEQGRQIHVPLGKVTLLKDLNGDGSADFFHDVVSGLPGAWYPGEIHQNNGIAFGTDGLLYITSGITGERLPKLSDYEGTILRCKSDGADLEIFASGLRNPFDLAFGPDGQLFCTDNDADDLDHGDELNHVVFGKNYGFPYADGRVPHPEGTIAPLLVTDGTGLEGLVWANPASWPEEYRRCFYVVSFRIGQGEIWRVRLQPEGTTYRAERKVFARIPSALDITLHPDGTIYVSSFHSKKIYRIRYVGSQG